MLCRAELTSLCMTQGLGWLLSLLLQRGQDCHPKVGDQGRGVTVLLLHIKHSGITSKLQVGVLGFAQSFANRGMPSRKKSRQKQTPAHVLTVCIVLSGPARHTHVCVWWEQSLGGGTHAPLIGTRLIHCSLKLASLIS